MFPTLVLAAAFAGPLLSTVTVGGSCDQTCPSGRLVVGAGEIVGRRPDGWLVVLTARHVVEKMAEPSVYLREEETPGERFSELWLARDGRTASVIAEASDADLALVSFRPRAADAYAVAKLVSGGTPDSGDVIGDPNGEMWIASPFHFLESASDTYVVECSTCGPGDSGGGVFDDSGRLAGILIKQRVDPSKIVDGEAAGTTQFQVVAAAKVRAFLASTAQPWMGGASPATDPRDRGVWARFDAMRGDVTLH
ncbi:MAG: trypsin-like peptidase domain-containing protein [Candidatus Eremiobacteraeota bacterium]|nr:trypsin-like peptidase domain-containing protein [Candidatus Eremiobacteraeota bacterium]